MAILTRPNLVPLAIVPATWLLWRALRERDTDAPGAETPAAFLSRRGGRLPCGGGDQRPVYGSPFVSGYGSSVEGTFRIGHFWVNLARYSTWLIQSNTPLVILAVAAPFCGAPRGWRRADRR